MNVVKLWVREPGAKQESGCWLGKEEMNSSDFSAGENSTRMLAVDYMKEIMWLFHSCTIFMSKAGGRIERGRSFIHITSIDAYSDLDGGIER